MPLRTVVQTAMEKMCKKKQVLQWGKKSCYYVRVELREKFRLQPFPTKVTPGADDDGEEDEEDEEEAEDEVVELEAPPPAAPAVAVA